MMKYKNKKITFKGIKFDSIKERDYYTILKNYENIGRIKDLKLQVPFELIPSYKINNKTIRGIKYIADFTYIQDNKLHIVDVKGYRTEVYKLKKKLFEYKYKIEIEEI